MLKLIFSFLPVIILMIIIYYQDRFEKEPISMLIKAFLGGMATVIPVTLFGLILSYLNINISNTIIDSTYQAFLGAAIPEELFKFLFLYWIVWKNKNFNEYFDGIVYAVFVSLGFACIENIMYVFQFGLSVVPARTVLTVPAHFFFGVMMGYYFSLAKFIPENRKKYLRLSIFLPIIFHGFFDFFLFMYDSENGMLSLIFFVLFLVLVSILWVFGIKTVQRLNKRRSPTEHDNEELINIKAIEKEEYKKNKLTTIGRLCRNGYIIYAIFMVMGIFSIVISFFEDRTEEKPQKTEQKDILPISDSISFPGLDYSNFFAKDSNNSGRDLFRKIEEGQRERDLRRKKAAEEEWNKAKDVTDDDWNIGEKIKLGNKLELVKDKNDSIVYDSFRKLFRMNKLKKNESQPQMDSSQKNFTE